MWYPGYERPYNERMSNAVTVALARELLFNAYGGQVKTGLPEAVHYDIVTPALLIRPRLQTDLVMPPEYRQSVFRLSAG